MLLLVLRCNAATAKGGEIAIFGGRLFSSIRWGIGFSENVGRALLWGLGEGMRGGFFGQDDRIEGRVRCADQGIETR